MSEQSGPERSGRTDRIAAIDCGTNTIKLLIAEASTGALRPIVRRSAVVRLGEGVDRTGRLADAALQRTFSAIDDYARLIRERDVSTVRFCATSATRDSENAAHFGDGVEARLGVRPEVLSGEEEAALSFLGATAGMSADVPRPVLVIDVGGGSTELVVGTSEAEEACSMDVGGVRLFERHLATDPPTPAEIAACSSDIDEALDSSGVPLAEARTVVGIAGTFTTIAAATLDLPRYDADAIHGAVLVTEDVVASCDRLVAMSTEERRALPFMHPGRADVIAAGALIVRSVLARTGCQTVRISESDILEGIAADMVG